MSKSTEIKKKVRFPTIISTSFINNAILILLKLLILVVLVGLLGGIVKTFMELEELLHTNVEEALRTLLLNVITMLAVVEVIKTAVSYISDGRVRVTYIVDTVLIIMLNEVISLWFKGPTFYQVTALSSIIITLIFVRLLAIKYSPNNE